MTAPARPKINPAGHRHARTAAIASAGTFGALAVALVAIGVLIGVRNPGGGSDLPTLLVVALFLARPGLCG